MFRTRWMTWKIPLITNSQPTNKTEIIVASRVSPIAIVPSMISAIPSARNHPHFEFQRGERPTDSHVRLHFLIPKKFGPKIDTVRASHRYINFPGQSLVPATMPPARFATPVN